MLSKQRSWSEQITSFVRKINRYSKRRLSLRETVIIAGASFLAIIVVFYVFVFQFQNAKIDRLEKQWKESSHLMHKMSLNIVEQRSDKMQFRPMPTVKPLDYFRTKHDAALKRITDLTLEHGLYLSENKTVSVDHLANNFSKYRILFVLSGKYADIGEFLFALYNEPILIEFTRVDMQPEKGTYLNKLTCELDMYIYRGEQL